MRLRVLLTQLLLSKTTPNNNSNYDDDDDRKRTKGRKHLSIACRELKGHNRWIFQIKVNERVPASTRRRKHAK